MLAVLGDVHRSFPILESQVSALPASVTAVLQVGDLGLTAADVAQFLAGRDPVLRLGRPVYWIDGNWDDFGGLSLRTRPAPVALLPNLIYVPRGSVLCLDGLRIGFLGGAESLAARETRTAGHDWWPDLEGVSAPDVQRLLGQAAAAGGLDLLVTHAPPAPAVLAMLGHAASASSRLVHDAQVALGFPPVVSGHLHQSWHSSTPPMRVLDELELVPLLLRPRSTSDAG